MSINNLADNAPFLVKQVLLIYVRPVAIGGGRLRSSLLLKDHRKHKKVAASTYDITDFGDSILNLMLQLSKQENLLDRGTF